MSPGAAGAHTRRSLAWDVRHGPRNYVTIVGAHVVASGAAFAATWLATRLLGAAGYGVVAAVLAASQGVMQVTLHWSAPSVARFGCIEFVERGRIAAAFWARLAILGPNLLLVVLTAPWWLPAIGRWLTIPPGTVGLVLAHCVVMTLWVHVQQGLQAAKSPRLLGFLMAGERLTIVAVLLVLAGASAASSFGAVLAYVVGPLAMTLAGLAGLRALVFTAGHLDGPGVKDLLRFSIPLMPQWVLGYLSSHALDAFFITHYLTVRDFGIFWIAYQVAGVVVQLALLGGTLMLPVFVTLHVERREGDTRRILGDVLPVLSLAWTACCAAAAAIAGPLLPLIFGSEYAPAGLLVWPLLAAGALAGPALGAYLPYLNAVSGTLGISLVAALGALTNVVFDAALIPPFGLSGCAWATAVASAVAGLAVAVVVARRSGAGVGRTLEASLPMVLAAGFASWTGHHVGALLVAWLGCALAAGLRRREVVDGVRAIVAAGLIPRRGGERAS